MNQAIAKLSNQTPAIRLGLSLICGLFIPLFFGPRDYKADPYDLFLTVHYTHSPVPSRNTGEPDRSGYALLRLLGALLLGTTCAAAFYEQKQKGLRAQLHRQQPINPHFIANSLNAIEYLMLSGQQKEASRYFAHFSQLSRRFYHTPSGAPVRLSEDLELLRHFLALCHLRFSNITCHVHLDLQLPAEKVMVPAMFLQSHIEETIWARLKPLKEPGRLDVTIRNTARHLCFQLEDNGPNLDYGRQLQNRRAAIPQERLQPISGNTRAEIVRKNVTDRDGRITGVRTDIRLPLRQQI